MLGTIAPDRHGTSMMSEFFMDSVVRKVMGRGPLTIQFYLRHKWHGGCEVNLLGGMSGGMWFGAKQDDLVQNKVL